MTDNETRVTSKTGGQKGAKDVAMGLIPVGPLADVARLYNFGAKKYSPNNWRKGYDWHLSYDALQRHATQFWNGEDDDEESGLPHLASVVFHALALMEFMKSYPEGDDRPPPSGTLFVEEPERKQVSTPIEEVAPKRTDWMTPSGICVAPKTRQSEDYTISIETQVGDFHIATDVDMTRLRPISPLNSRSKGYRRVRHETISGQPGMCYSCKACDSADDNDIPSLVPSSRHGDICPLYSPFTIP